MKYSFSIATGKGDEYRIMFIDADISLLAKDVRDAILKKNLDICPFRSIAVNCFHICLIHTWKVIMCQVS